MSDLKISQLTPAASLTGNELIPLAISGTNESATTSQVASLATSSLTDNYLPYNNAGVLDDSYLVNDGDVLKTIYSSIDQGLYLDFANNQFWLGDSVNGWGYKGDRTTGLIKVGDITGNYGYVITLDYDSANGFIASYLGGSYKGLLIDSQNQTYKLGDFNSDNNGNTLIVDDGTQLIKTTNQGIDNGLYIDFANSFYNLSFDSFGISCNKNQRNVIIGDYNEAYNATYLYIDDISQEIKSIGGFNNVGLKLDFANNQYGFGDYNSIINGTSIRIDDIAQTLTLNLPGGDLNIVGYSNLIFDTVPVSPTAGAIAGYLQVNINGIGRKIAYYAN